MVNERIPKPEVSRVFYLREPNGRIVTIAYTFNRETKTVKYGATIFRKEKPTDVWSRKNHRQTAEMRLATHPITINGFEDTSSIRDFNNRLRGMMYTRGVSSNSKVNSQQNTPAE